MLENGSEYCAHGDPHGDERFTSALLGELVGPYTAYRREWPVEGADDVGNGDRIGGPGKRPSAVATSMAAQQAGLAELTEDVDQESGRQVVSCGELVAGTGRPGSSRSSSAMVVINRTP